LLFPYYRKPDERMTATTLSRGPERMGKDRIGFSAHDIRASAWTMLN